MNIFPMLVYITLAGGLIIAILSAFAMRPVAIILGARGELLKNLCSVRKNSLHLTDLFHAAECIPELLCSCRKAAPRSARCCNCRCYQHASGFSVRSRVALGTCRCRDCYCLWRIDRRYLSDFLLWAQKFPAC